MENVEVKQKRLFEVKCIEFYPENKKQRRESSGSGIRFHEVYIEAAESVEWLIHDARLERIVDEIEAYEIAINT